MFQNQKYPAHGAKARPAVRPSTVSRAKEEPVKYEMFKTGAPQKQYSSADQREQFDRLRRALREAKTDADDVLRTVNQVANKTANTEASYHKYVRQHPEILQLEHNRFINKRVLDAEESKVEMECTPELVDGMYRRYLPTTVGRRNVVVDQDLQDIYYQKNYEDLFAQARDILVRRQEQLDDELDVIYVAAKQSMGEQ